jgi:hypothetical protein
MVLRFSAILVLSKFLELWSEQKYKKMNEIKILKLKLGNKFHFPGMEGKMTIMTSKK